MKKMLSTLLTIVLLFCVPFTSYANEIGIANNAIISDDIEVIEVGEGHELVHYGNVIIDDITTSEFRKITTQCDSGTSVYFENFSTDMATLSVNGEIVETYNMDELRASYVEWKMSEEDLNILEEYMHEHSMQNIYSDTLPIELQERFTVTYESDGAMLIKPVSDIDTYAVEATKIVMPAGSVTSTYEEYRAHEVDSKLRYSAICGRYLDMSIKDSMYNYTQIEKISYFYDAGTAVSTISGILKISSGTLLQSLAGVTTMVAGVLKLSSRIEYYFKEAYTFSALRQAFIYDYTSNNRDVSILTEYGSGEISLTWDYVNNEYINPSYKITGPAYPLTILPTTMYDSAQSIWEKNIEDYGYWKWGDI